uniref:Uncharacterized protein n=1 Tax=Aegilops tauschii TaxID=37682 RepID=R7W4Y3_AEGTA
MDRPNYWEAIADRGDETPVRPLVQEARVTTPCSSSEKSSTSSSGTKRRGRGSFLYDKSVLYSDQCGSERDLDDKRSDPARGGSKGHADEKDNKDAAKRFGTRHALVLYDFPPSTRTTDLERIFEKFGDHGVAIRWVNDSVALAVFRTPSSANEAQACVPPRYKVRSLKDNDDLLAKIDGTDLEPPTPRPKTSARTAQRLIAHGMGLKQFTTIDAGDLPEFSGEAIRPSKISTTGRGTYCGTFHVARSARAAGLHPRLFPPWRPLLLKVRRLVSFLAEDLGDVKRQFILWKKKYIVAASPVESASLGVVPG